MRNSLFISALLCAAALAACRDKTKRIFITTPPPVSSSLVETFDTDGVVESDPTAGLDEIYDMALDATSIYLVGNETGPTWRIEKRDRVTGALDPAFGAGEYASVC